MNNWPRSIDSIPKNNIVINSTLLHPGKIQILSQIFNSYRQTEKRLEKQIWIYAFFDHGFHLKDWFKNFQIIENFEIKWQKYADNLYFKLCRDFCNRNKHIKVSQPSISNNVRLMVIVENGKEDFFITYDNQYLPAEYLMNQVLGFWEEFAKNEL